MKLWKLKRVVLAGCMLLCGTLLRADEFADEFTAETATWSETDGNPSSAFTDAAFSELQPAAAPVKKAPPAFPGPKTLPNTGPYKPLFFDNDFSYKNDPCHDPVCFDEWKLVPFCLCETDFVFSTGGEIRHRYINQDNRLQPGGPGQTDQNLWRWRHYLDLKAGDHLRFYVEGIHGDMFGEELPPVGPDENRWDLLNAFVDILVYSDGAQTQTLRYGRQELLFGRQRLVSPLDWSNTRRNFEGFRYLVKDQGWKLDLFAVNPVNAATGFTPFPKYRNRFDEANRDVWFSGAYYTYTAIENTNVELYWLWLNDNEPVVGRADGDRHTVGARYTRLMPVDCGRVWDLDVEAAYQFGEDNGQDVQAGFATAVFGHTWKSLPWSPRIGGLFYYGSGDVDPNDATTNTFTVLFPLGHAYWGLTDNLSGQNLYDYSLQCDVKPTGRTTLTAAYHVFQLASDDDRLYNVAGAPLGTPDNGHSIGDALDLYGTFALNPNFDVQAGYSWFWYGSYVERTLPRDDATQFYVQTSLRY